MPPEEQHLLKNANVFNSLSCLSVVIASVILPEIYLVLGDHKIDRFIYLFIVYIMFVVLY